MRKVIIILSCCIALLLAGYASYRGYKVWKRNHMMSLARDYLAKSDGRNAFLCVQQVVRSDPNNLEACRMMADFSEVARSPQAILWRARVVELDPKPLTNRVAWAMTALKLGDVGLAQKAIESVDAADRKAVLYHRAAGAVAYSARQYAEAEAHLAELVRLEPTNLVTQLDLAALRLYKTDPQAAAQARTTLEGLSANPAVRTESLRRLEEDALSRKQMDNALALSRQLLRQTNSTFRDRVLHLTILHIARNPEQDAFLAGLQKEAQDSPPKIADLATWMVTSEQAPKAMAWIRTIPPAVRTNQPVPIVEAECHRALQDWPGLLTALDDQAWGDLDFLRLAYRTQAFRAQKSEANMKNEWHRTMEATEQRLGRLAMLLRTTTAWAWLAEQEEILWTIVNRFPSEKWALKELADRLYTAGQTQSLVTLFSRAAQMDPNNLGFKNNLATSALLLNAMERKPHELAQEVYQKAPTNSAYASTYAFSLHMQQKTAEALKILEQLTPQQLEDPGIAAYYGVILKASGNTAKARKYLELASKARLLPEEKKLVEQARRGN